MKVDFSLIYSLTGDYPKQDAVANWFIIVKDCQELHGVVPRIPEEMEDEYQLSLNAGYNKCRQEVYIPFPLTRDIRPLLLEHSSIFPLSITISRVEK